MSDETLTTTLHLRKFKPRDYQLPVLDALENAGYRKIFLLWHRRCLSGDTLIFMADSTKRKLSSLKVGDEIYSLNCITQTLEIDRVKNVWKTGPKETRIISNLYCDYLPKLKASVDHFFAIRSPGMCDISFIPTMKLRMAKGSICHLSNARYPTLISTDLCRIKIINGPVEELYDIETEKNHNFIANGYLVHNSGKDVVAFNCMIRAAIRKVGVYFYCLPTYSHARKVIYDGILSGNNGQKFLDFIPPELIANKNGQEMKITLLNGSLIQLVGSDTASQSLVGTNPQGVVFSEWALAEPSAYQFIRPALLYNDGWAIFVTTPRGRNHAFEMHEVAKNSSDWFCSTKTVNDTGVISLEEIHKERQTMSEDMIQQEYFCSYTAGLEGSYYCKYIDKMRLNNQISMVPWEPSFKVHTAWDLGVHDKTIVIMFQVCGQVVRIIDMLEGTDKGLDYYAKTLQEKPYFWGNHFAPHDIKVRELSTGLSRLELARRLGISFQVLPNLPIEDGIEQCKVNFNKIWIDETKCANLIKALESYRREWDDKRKVYKDNAIHNDSSHYADSFRYLNLALPKTQDGMSAQELRKSYEETVYGRQDSVNPVFRDVLSKY